MRLTSSGAVVPYSEAEREVFSLLSRKKQTTSELVDALWERRGVEQPFHARTRMISVLRGLRMKIEANGEPFTLEKEWNRGPHPISHWLEPKEKRKKKR